MKTNLSDIAAVRTGIFAKSEADGDIVYLQARDFDEFGNLLEQPHPNLKMTSVIKRHLLSKGDVLVAAKGTKIFAAVFEAEFPAVPSTTFLVVRPTQKVIPDYLAWILNSDPIQMRLKRSAMGSSLISISKSTLAKLELNIPSVEKQAKVIKILKLSESERVLNMRIAALRQLMIQQEINKAID